MGRTIRENLPVMRPADLRKTVAEWVAQGFSVSIKPSGEIIVTPAAQKPGTDPFDSVDFAR